MSANFMNHAAVVIEYLEEKAFLASLPNSSSASWLASAAKRRFTRPPIPNHGPHDPPIPCKINLKIIISTRV